MLEPLDRKSNSTGAAQAGANKKLPLHTSKKARVEQQESSVSAAEGSGEAEEEEDFWLKLSDQEGWWKSWQLATQD